MSLPIVRKAWLQDELLLASRILVALLFVLFGWEKLAGFTQTVGMFHGMGIPMPGLAAAIAVVMEVPVALAIAAGAFTRPLVLLMAFYTLGTALLGHPYWTLSGAAQYAAEINFYKNIAIIGGLFALYVAGPGRWSIDALVGRRASH